MAESDLKNFNCDAFAKDLSSQASQVVPSDIQKPDKDFVIELIFRFCKMAGDALLNEENSKLNASQASLITQFIGEWIFHKSIDIIRAGVDMQYREAILQKVAFTVFDIAKKAVENDLPQDQLISLVEAQVKKCFTKAMEDLKERGILTQQVADNALSQSNIDSMAMEQIEEETAIDIASMSDSKVIKLASLAVLMKGFPTEKIKNILQKFDKPERDVLMKYLKMPDLEEKLDTSTTIRCFEEMKSALPEAIVISYDKAFKKMCKIVKNSSRERILTIINKERPAIKDFVNSCYTKNKKKIPAHIADIVSKYLEEHAS
ncbi:MAG: hypothetical protein IKU37_01035 [Candidatus Gastranaerophilales bacterium]|nr:hypothetical protein [Candidatus Gastranaerophilales bacterium]